MVHNYHKHAFIKDLKTSAVLVKVELEVSIPHNIQAAQKEEKLNLKEGKGYDERYQHKDRPPEEEHGKICDVTLVFVDVEALIQYSNLHQYILMCQELPRSLQQMMRSHREQHNYNNQ